VGDGVIISAPKNVWIIIAINYDVPYDLSLCVLTRAELLNAQIRPMSTVLQNKRLATEYPETAEYPFNGKFFGQFRISPYRKYRD